MTIPQDLHTADVSSGCMFYDVTKRDGMTSVQSADVIMSSIDSLDLLGAAQDLQGLPEPAICYKQTCRESVQGELL